MKIMINDEHLNLILNILLDQFVEQREQFITFMGSIENDKLIVSDYDYWEIDEVDQTENGFNLTTEGLAYSYKRALEQKSNFIISVQTYHRDKVTHMNMDLLSGNEEQIIFLTEFYEGMLSNTVYIGGIISSLGQLDFYKYDKKNKSFTKIDWKLQENKKKLK